MHAHPTLKCWQCSKRFMMFGPTHPTRAGEVIFVEVELPTGTKVKVHKICVLAVKRAISARTQVRDPREYEPHFRRYKE